jgi:hypothetical protein
MKIIYTNTEGGVSVITPTGELSIEEVAVKDVPEGVAFEIVEDDAIPSDRTFRNAWVMGDCCIDHDLGRCKDIAHERRRVARAEEFAPLDDIIAKRIPGTTAEEAETGRQRIRDKYAKQQAAIDAATTVDQLKEALK